MDLCHEGTQATSWGRVGLAVAPDPDHVGTHFWYYGDRDRWLLTEWISVGYWLELMALLGIQSPPSHHTESIIDPNTLSAFGTSLPHLFLTRNIEG